MDYMIINTALTDENFEQWNDLPRNFPTGRLTRKYDEEIDHYFQTFSVTVFTNNKEQAFVQFNWTIAEWFTSPIE